MTGTLSHRAGAPGQAARNSARTGNSVHRDISGGNGQRASRRNRGARAARLPAARNAGDYGHVTGAPGARNSNDETDKKDASGGELARDQGDALPPGRELARRQGP